MVNIRPRDETVFCYIQDRIYSGCKKFWHLATPCEKMLENDCIRQYNEVFLNVYAKIRVDTKETTDLKM
ncbi:hypothetical protein CWI38_0162p0020 [Hamiltosporidium tvaerminnensis]|uniref:Uncharacterized protein n=1 Tax=Hamiltosporidium tvaerminnensis TaxID=1176355 RepID=A0A4V2JY67_9MICR|nr:hypothetical protein CWI38_0162p0020 [Hamiltosporidium tvaerminnensis]